MEALRLTRAQEDSQNPHSPLGNLIQLGSLSFIYLFFLRLTFGKMTSNGKYVNYFPEDCSRRTALTFKFAFKYHCVIIDEVSHGWNEGPRRSSDSWCLCETHFISLAVTERLFPEGCRIFSHSESSRGK